MNKLLKYTLSSTLLMGVAFADIHVDDRAIPVDGSGGHRSSQCHPDGWCPFVVDR